MIDLDVICETRPLVATLQALGYPITPGKLRVWHHRGRLPSQGRTPSGHHLYKLRDALQLLHP